jgi:hypothetical protein
MSSRSARLEWADDENGSKIHEDQGERTTMESFSLRPVEPTDRWEIAELIFVSTNAWYQARGRPPIFSGGAETTVVFFDVYDALDPGCGVVAVDRAGGRLAGSCFYHPRPTPALQLWFFAIIREKFCTLLKKVGALNCQTSR